MSVSRNWLSDAVPMYAKMTLRENPREKELQRFHTWR